MALNIPGSTHPIQSRLRINPDKVIAEYDFVVVNEVYRQGTIGGPCRLSCRETTPRVYTLSAEHGFGDWFFPYVSRTEGGVGTCQVPADQQHGTIVATGGMNGCALQVNRVGRGERSTLHFYHDTNSRSMKGKLTPGDVVALIQPDQYCGVDGMGAKLAGDYSRAHSKSGAVFEHYLLTIRDGALWKIFSSSVLRIQSTDNSVKFQSFRPKPTKLVGMFPA